MDISGYFNADHRQWQYPGGQCQPCKKCPAGYHRDLEVILRQILTNKLIIEKDNFDTVFENYPNITFCSQSPPHFENEIDFIRYHLEQKLVLGVYVSLPKASTHHFVLPVMKGGKMWQMLLRGYRHINIEIWQNFKEEQFLECLICLNYPFDVYPCNFIVNENVYTIKSILWPDYRRPHRNKKTNEIVSYVASVKIEWPPSIARAFRDEKINHAGNMSVYTTGDIFYRMLTLLLKKTANKPPSLIQSLFKSKGMALRRGEIDEAITQTRRLHKNDETLNKNKNKVGRFHKNVASNSFINICTAACGLQKVLPKDSKTVEPRMITDSEIGFIDLLFTPDTSQRCGTLLESTPDLIISTRSMICEVHLHLATLFPSLREDEESGGIRIILNHSRVYTFSEEEDEQLYVKTSYYLKCRIPCVELLRHNSRLWSCTSLSRSWYKINPNNGLLYTPKELDFSVDNDDEYPLHLAWWRNRTNNNIFGPSLASIPRPNSSHLPRVSYGVCSSRHYAGIPDNTHSVGEIHQKMVLKSYYTFRERSSDIFPTPAQYVHVCVANWNNPEDGITVKASSLQRGLFCGESFETITVIFPEMGRGTFEPLIEPRTLLRKGMILGRILGNGLEVSDIRNYTFKGDLQCHHRKEDEIFLIWTGKEEERVEDRRRLKRYHYSMAYREKYSYHYRCVSMHWEPIVATNQQRFRLVTCSNFVPSLGDKLQTPTSQKGVISYIIENDADVPFVNIYTKEKEKWVLTSVLPDIIINPHFIKRQTCDLFTQMGRETTQKKNCFMNDCFYFDIKDTRICLEMGQSYATGRLYNPYTGRPYEAASLFRACYVCVTNHRASAVLHASKSEEVRLSELSGAPVRGKDGGLAIGPMEHSALAESQRIDIELAHMRSNYTPVTLGGGGRIAGSTSFRRFNDDWTQADLPFGYICDPLTFITANPKE